MTKAKVLILFFIVVILIVILVCYQELNYYTLDKVSSMLNSVKLPKNVYIKEYESTNDYVYCTDIYIKDDIKNTYYRRKSFSPYIDNINLLSIYDNQKLIDINYINKTVSISNTESNYNIYKI